MNDYQLVRSEIASFIGTSISEWDPRTKSDVTSAIRRGINSVVHNSANHQWTWMRPEHRFTTADGQRRYPLPADFEQVIDHISFDGDNYQHPPVLQLPSSRLQQLYSEYPGTGVPANFAWEPRTHDGTTEQVQELVLHPTPNGTYQLVMLYQAGPIRDLTSDRPYFPGGPEHLELFISACLAQAESIFMDGPMTDRQDQFRAELAAAISRDYRRSPRNLGPMKGHRVQDWFRWKLQTQHEGHVDSV